MIKKVLISGGAGFIGAHLTELLLAKGIKVVILEHSAADIWRIEPFLKDVGIYYSDEKINYPVARIIFLWKGF